MSTEVSDICNWIKTQTNDLATAVVVSTYPHYYESQALPRIMICPLATTPLKSNQCEQLWEHQIEVVYINKNSLKHSDLSGIDTTTTVIDRVIGGDYYTDQIAWRVDAQPSQTYVRFYLPEGYDATSVVFVFNTVRNI